MSDWLSVIEDELSLIRKNGMMGRKADFQRERMARVIRELGEYALKLEGKWLNIHSMRSEYLSPDAKELLK